MSLTRAAWKPLLAKTRTAACKSSLRRSVVRSDKGAQHNRPMGTATLDEIFRRTWSNLAEELHRIELSDAVLREQLERFASVYLGSWLETPDLIRVLVREVARGPDLGARAGEIDSVLAPLTRMIERGARRGEVRTAVDARLAAVAFYGALEEILTGYVLDQLPSRADDVDRAIATVTDVVAAGLAP